MKRIFIILTLALVLSGKAYADRTQELNDSLKFELSQMRTPQDSLVVLTNLYDLLALRMPAELPDLIIETARRANDQRTALEIISYESSRNMRNDTILQGLMDKAHSFPPGPKRRETITLIKMMRNMHAARYADSEERADMLNEMLEEITLHPAKDLYDRIAQLHGVCMVLSEDPSGELLDSYMDSLGVLINKLPAADYTLRNAYYTHAASTYAGTNPLKSIAADKAVLEEIKRLQEYYKSKGRVFRNYDGYLYNVYTRLLANHSILDDKSVQEFYDKAMHYVDISGSAKISYSKFPAPDIYLAIHNKDYAKALPLIESCIDSPKIKPRRLQLLRYMMECARQTGNKDALLYAATEYSAMMDKELAERSHGAYRELRIAYAVHEMKEQYGELEMERQQSEASLQRTIIIIVVIALVAVVILAIVLFRLYRRNKLMAVNLTRSNEKLKKESENLKASRAESIRARDLAQKANNLKSDFIKNMSYEVKVPLQAITEYSHLIADCAASEGKSHMERYANLLDLNSELLSTIIEDVLKLSEMESTPMSVQGQVVNVRALAEATINSVIRRVNPGVDLKLDESAGRVDMFTDPVRVQQILNNLLTNAAKFTEEGSITVGYRLIDNDTKVEISVSDTGIGINPENKEKIFERFVKLDHDSQGAGLGLTVSRMIARNLGGDLNLDTDYTGGARFVLVIPKR